MINNGKRYIFIRQWMCRLLSVEYVYSFTKKHNKTTEAYPLFRMKEPRRNRLTTSRYSNSCKHCSRRRLTRFKKGVNNTQEGHVLERWRASSSIKLSLFPNRGECDYWNILTIYACKFSVFSLFVSLLVVVFQWYFLMEPDNPLSTRRAPRGLFW